MIKGLLNIIGYCGIVLVPITGGILGALGGASNSSKTYRRVMLPILLTTYAFSQITTVWVLIIMSIAAWFSMGYGVPDESDSGSALGRLVYRITKQNHFITDVVVRGIIGVLVSLSLIIVPILLKNWTAYIVLSSIIIAVYSIFSWRNLGTYRLFGKDLLWSETMVYSIISLAVVVLTYWRV